MKSSEKIYDENLKLKEDLTNVVEDLYITSKFPPLNDVSGIVFSKRIIKLNKKVDVVFSSLDGDKDFDLEALINNYIDEKFIVDGNYSPNSSKGINFFRKEGLKKLMKSKKKYKTVVSRAWTVESHFLALDYKLQNPDVVWIAEFSDPLRFDINNVLRRPTFSAEKKYFKNINKKIREINLKHFGDNVDKYWPEIKSGDNLYFLVEYLPFLFADIVRFTNPNQRDSMLDDFPFDIKDFVMQKSEVSRHPTLDEEYYFLKESSYEVDENYLNFAYFGTYLGKRHLEFLFKSLEELDEEIRDKIRLHLFVPNPEVFKLSLTNQRSIVIGKKAPFLEFLNITTKMDVLIVNDLLTEGVFDANPFLPSKLADYIGSGADIWAVCEEGSSMDKFSFKYKSYVNDFDSSRNIFKKIISDKLDENGDIFNKNIESDIYYQGRLTDLNSALDELYKQKVYWVNRTKLAERNLNSAKKDVAAKNKNISSLASERDSLNEEVREKEKDISSLASERDSLIEDINNKKDELDSLTAQVNELRDDFVELHDVTKLSFDNIKLKDEIISDKDKELDYYRNSGSIVRGIMSPFEYCYLLIKSPKNELRLNYDLFKLVKSLNWFNRWYYLDNNKDLSRFLWGKLFRPELHYVCHGISEHRFPNRETRIVLSKKEIFKRLMFIKNEDKLN